MRVPARLTPQTNPFLPTIPAPQTCFPKASIPYHLLGYWDFVSISGIWIKQEDFSPGRVVFCRARGFAQSQPRIKVMSYLCWTWRPNRRALLQEQMEPLCLGASPAPLR